MTLTRRNAMIGPLAAGAAALARPARAQPPGRPVLRFVPFFDLKSLDPIVDTNLATLQHGYMIYDTLFAMDRSFTPRPQMVDTVQVSPDGLSYDFRLRAGLRFHDGTAVTANDCAASIRRWARRDVMGKLVLARTASLDAPDESWFRLRLTEPFPLLIHALAKMSSSPCFIMRERDAATDPSVAVTSVVGSGPFRFLADGFVPGARVSYGANAAYVPRPEAADGYAGSKAAGVDRVEWHVITDPATQVNALLAGEVDIVSYPALDLLPRLRAEPAIAVRLFDRLGWTAYIRPNQLFPPFDDVRARQALAHLMDQTASMQAAAGQPENWGRCESFLACTPVAGKERFAQPDLALARQLFTASGYGGDPIVILDPVDSPVLSSIAAAMVSQLCKIDMAVQPYSVDTATMLSRRASTNPPDRGGWNLFPGISLGQELANPLTSFPLASPCRADPSDPPPGWFGWPCDPGVEALRLAWARAAGEAERSRIAAELDRQAAIALPFIPAGRIYTPAAYRTAVRGLPDMPVLALWHASVAA